MGPGARGELGVVTLALLLVALCTLPGRPVVAQSGDGSGDLQRCFDELGLSLYANNRPVEMPSVAPYYGLRLMGMGGAFTAVAEGIESLPYTLTALANRRPDQGGWFDYDATLTWVVPANIMDVDYNGCPTRGSLTLVAGGGLLRFGRIGVGSFIDQITFPSSADLSSVLSIIRSSTGLAWALPGDQLVLGLGLHTLAYSLRFGGAQASALALAPGINALYRPRGKRYRLGASFQIPQRAAIEAKVGGVAGTPVPGLDGLPEALVDPWRLRVGAAYWVGEGIYNQEIPVSDAEPGRPVAIAGLLMSGDLVLVFPRGVHGNPPVGLEAFFEGRSQPVNPRPTLSVRMGVETQPVADRVRMRGGLWVEPSRFVGISPRMHVSGGLDVRLFNLYGVYFKGSAAFDVAPGYSVSSLSLGLW